jgi:hypothetical protein
MYQAAADKAYRRRGGVRSSTPPRTSERAYGRESRHQNSSAYQVIAEHMQQYGV